MPARIAIVDTGLCNVDSMWRALEECGAKADVTSDPGDLELADKIVLPGVGAFPDAMRVLGERRLADALREQGLVESIPVLGVCLGMQLLAEESVEVTPTRGLGLLRGSVVRLEPTASYERIPHVGWNEVNRRADHMLLAGVPDGADCYFVHSYHLRCSDEADVVATTPYCGGFVSMVGRDHILGAQFHPEKSQRHGLRLLRNFVEA